MSRSRKKYAILKDTWKHGKAFAHRRHRRAVKIAVHTEQEVLPLSAELTNQYDVCDWVYVAQKSDSFYEKFKRK
jgi:hypothetical protein